MQIEGQEVSLMVTPRELLETSIAQLQMLAAFLSDQLGMTADGSAEVEARACKEILCAVSSLIETYQKPVHASAGQMTSRKAAHDTGPWEARKSATSHGPKDTIVQRRCRR